MPRRTGSSQRWRQRQERDIYVEQATRAGWRSRAVFKLEQIQGKEQLLRRALAHALPGQRLPLQPIACGRYDDVFEKTAGTWRFRSKHIEVTLLGDMSQHLNINIG